MNTNAISCNKSCLFPKWGIKVILKQDYDIIKEISKYCSDSYCKNFKEDMPTELKQFICKFPDTYVIGISWENMNIKSYKENGYDYSEEKNIATEIGKQLILLSNFKWTHSDKKYSRLVDSKSAFKTGEPCYIITSNGKLVSTLRELITTPIQFSSYYEVEVVDKKQFRKACKQYHFDKKSVNYLLWSYQGDYDKIIKRQELFPLLCSKLSSDSFECRNWQFYYQTGKEAINAIVETIMINKPDVNKSGVRKKVHNALLKMEKCTAQFNYDYTLFGIVAIVLSNSGYAFEVMHSASMYNLNARNDFICKVKELQNKSDYIKTILINYNTRC